MLSLEALEKEMHVGQFGRNIIYLDETDSTNEYLKRIAKETDSGTLVVADCQTSGRGRKGKSWSSPRGQSVFMSLLIKDDIRPENASKLTLIAALAVRKALQEYADGIRIKWPNDIIINGRKICGILTEMRSEGGRTAYLIVGMGINVNNELFPEELENVAASLFSETGQHYNRAEIAGRIITKFEDYYTIFRKSENLSELMEEYNQNLVNAGQEVEILSSQENYRAEAEGIDEEGRLLVRRLEDGELLRIVSGEVSVRGVYGYV